MRYGASTFIWASPFSNRTLDLFDRVKAIGFDILEICVEDPATIDAPAIYDRAARTGVSVTICGAFGPDRDLSSEDAAVRQAGLSYLERCIDFASELKSPFVSGPMYAAVGNTRLLDESARGDQWERAVDSLKRAAAYAAGRGVKLAIEPLNRFETDLVNTVDQALRLIDDVEADNVGLLLDTFHMNIEEDSFAEAIRTTGPLLGHFHIGENNRRVPGKGGLPWHEIGTALREIGYDGAVVMEPFVKQGGGVGSDIKVWRDLSSNADEAQMDEDARRGLAFSRYVLG